MGIDGVLAMQEKYASAGYKWAYGNERYAGIAKANKPDRDCRKILPDDFERIIDFDAKFFPAKRSKILTLVNPKRHHSLAHRG